MITTSLAQLAQALGASGAPQSSDFEVTSVVTDNRQVTPGALFVAIAGERTDGNAYGADALSRGATAVMTANRDAAREAGVPGARMLVVEDVVSALGMLAQYNLERIRSLGSPDFTVVAVTGSVGKTTTKDLLADVLAPRGEIVAPPKSFNNEIGLPLTVLQADENTRTLVLEMGADHIGNIDYLTSIAPPDISVVLRVAPAHVGEFGGIEAVARAKAEIIAGTRPSGHVVLNADDPRVYAMAAGTSLPITYFSASGSALSSALSSDSSAEELVPAARETMPVNCICAEDITIDDVGRARFTLVTAGGSASVHLKLVGAHHVTNALAAASVAQILGQDVAQTAQILSSAAARSPHRMDVRSVEGMTIIDDSFNANPASMQAGIEALAQISQASQVPQGHRRRSVAVVGDMLELGAQSRSAHEAVGRSLASHGIDVVLSVGNEARIISESLENSHAVAHHVDTASQALSWLRSHLRTDDVVLLKGSHGSQVWTIADAFFTEGVGC